MAHSILSLSVFAIKIEHCVHQKGNSVLTSLPHNKPISDVFKMYHENTEKPFQKGIEFEAYSKLPGLDELFTIDSGLFVGDIVSMNCEFLKFTCKGTDEIDIHNILCFLLCVC